jgi:hypothetical protein
MRQPSKVVGFCCNCCCFFSDHQDYFLDWLDLEEERELENQLDLDLAMMFLQKTKSNIFLKILKIYSKIGAWVGGVEQSR